MSRLQYKLHDEWSLTNAVFVFSRLTRWNSVAVFLDKNGCLCVCVCWNLPWLQTPLMQLTVAVITVVTPCLLTTGGQRSGAKVALMIKLYKSRLHLVFFFQGSCFAFCTSFAHDILSVLRHVRAVRLCARGAVVSQCAMHNTWRGGLLLLRFTGELVHTLQFHLLLVYFITETCQ